FLEIVKKENLNLIGQPKAELKKIAFGGECLYEIEVEIIPEIEIGDYKKIAKKVFSEKREIEVSEEEVQDSLNFLRESRAKIKKLENGEEIKELPNLDDEFAKSLGRFSSLEELKKSIKEGIFEEKRIKEKQRLRQKFLEEISKDLCVELPQTLVNSFVEENLNQLKYFVENQGMNFETYLKEINQTREGLEAKLEEEARNQIRHSLVLYKIAKLENIKPTEEEIRLLAQRIINQQSIDSLNEIEKRRLLDYAKERITFEKVFEFLENQ
ncbi:MAG TPA: hypothetical protein ENG32_01030, partial [bacterium]|nr:hypothetical protein [bacterium]